MTVATPPRLRLPANEARASLARPVLAVVVLGLAVGAATSVLQTYLDTPWASLANAASPWLVPAFAVGLLWRRVTSAALAGFVVCGLELLGYYATAVARGYSASPNELRFWGACAVIAGPVLGAAGWAWRQESPRLRGLGASVLVAAWLAEAAVAYAWRLHYYSTAILFATIGLFILVGLGTYRRQHRRIVQWLALVLPIGILAEYALGLVSHQAF
ncbi:MAG TPA: DUF6518 family protein [Mycobacteriales bacterium]|nr:DUF6518 family protein [Mycobacteriales bacterium]